LLTKEVERINIQQKAMKNKNDQDIHSNMLKFDKINTNSLNTSNNIRKLFEEIENIQKSYASL
jgi:hypothetical protein